MATLLPTLTLALPPRGLYLLRLSDRALAQKALWGNNRMSSLCLLGVLAPLQAPRLHEHPVDALPSPPM